MSHCNRCYQRKLLLDWYKPGKRGELARRILSSEKNGGFYGKA